MGAALRLSMTSSDLRDLTSSHSVSITGRAPWSRTPSTVATAWGTSVLSRNAPRSSNHTPSSNSDTSWAATCNANRVLAAPPGPARVSSVVWSMSATTWAASASRPTKLVSCRGRLCGTRRAILSCRARESRTAPGGRWAAEQSAILLRVHDKRPIGNHPLANWFATDCQHASWHLRFDS